MDHATAYATQTLMAVRTVKAFNTEKLEASKYAEKLSGAEAVNYSLSLRKGIAEGVSTFFIITYQEPVVASAHQRADLEQPQYHIFEASSQ